MSALRVVVADDNAFVRAGLVNLLATEPGVDVVAQAGDGEAACALVEEHRPDVLLLDVRMPRLDGLGALRRVAGSTAVLMLTHAGDEPTVLGAMAAGARGYVVHAEVGVDGLLDAIRTVAGGGSYLSPSAGTTLAAALAVRAAPDHRGPTPGPGRPDHGLSAREREVMELIATGLDNRAVAGRLFLSEKTVKNHVNAIFAKLGVTTRTRAVSRWLRAEGAGEPGR